MPESLAGDRIGGQEVGNAIWLIGQAMEFARRRAREDMNQIRELERLLDQARDVACRLEEEIAHHSCEHWQPDMLARCIAAVESVGHWTDSDMGLPLTDGIDEMWITKGNAIAALRALEEKPHG